MYGFSSALPVSARRYLRSRTYAIVLVALVSICVAKASQAQFDRVINVPSDEPTWYLASGTQLNLFDGGVLPQEFRDVYVDRGAELNVYGGHVDAKVTVAGALNVLGGNAGSLVEAYNAQINVEGGYVGYIEANGSTDVLISGGQVYSYHQAPSGSGTITGGSFGYVRGAVTLVGADFHLNGVATNASAMQLLGGDALAGTLSDGSVLILTGNLTYVNLVQSALPLSDPSLQHIDHPSTQAGLRPGESARVVPGGELPSFFSVFRADLEVAGGEIGNYLKVMEGQVVVKQGNIGAGLTAFSGGSIRVEGGSIGAAARALSGGKIDVFGGRLSRGVGGASGSGSFALHGADFQIDGVSVSPGVYGSLAGKRLTGTLSDGSPYVLKVGSFYLPGSIDLVEAPVPAVNTNWQYVLTDESPNGLRIGERLVVQTGGAVPQDFTAIGAELRVEGGTVGKYLNALNSSIELVSGNVGDEAMLHTGSRLRVVGGHVGTRLSAEKDTLIFLDGGRIDERMTTEGDFSMSGGYLGRLARIGGKFELRGGVIASGFDLGLASWDIHGGEFRLNGEPIAAPSVSLGNLDVLTGTLEDGSPFVFTQNDGGYGRPINLHAGSLPPIHSAPYVVTQPWSMNGLRSGETAIVKAGGVLSESLAVVGGRLLVKGGEVGSRLEVYDGQVSIRGGKVGQHLRLMGNSQGALEQGEVDGVSLVGNSSLTVTGGRVSRYLETASSGVLTVTGGDIDASVRVGLANAPRNTIATTEVNIEGGTFRSYVLAYRGAQIDVSGGEFLANFDAQEGSEIVISGGIQSPHFRAFPGSAVTIIGTEFLIDGERFDGLVPGVEQLLTLRNVELSGTLANGDPFRFMLNSKEQYYGYFNPKAELRLLLVPEPAAMVAILGCVLPYLAFRRSWASPKCR